MRINAVVLGGGGFKGSTSVSAKGLIEVNGRPMVDYVVDALHGCEQIEKIAVVLPVEVTDGRWLGEIDRLIVRNGDLPENIQAGVAAVENGDRLLLISGDLPLITCEAVSDFISRCSKKNADLYYPVIDKEEMERCFTGANRTYAKFREGKFTGGNMVLLKRELIMNNMAFMRQTFELRKSPLRLAGVLGALFLIRFVLGRLSLRQIEERLGSMIGARCVAVPTPFGEIGMDVDKTADLEFVTRFLVNGTAGEST